MAIETDQQPNNTAEIYDLGDNFIGLRSANQSDKLYVIPGDPHTNIRFLLPHGCVLRVINQDCEKFIRNLEPVQPITSFIHYRSPEVRDQEWEKAGEVLHQLLPPMLGTCGNIIGLIEALLGQDMTGRKLNMRERIYRTVQASLPAKLSIPLALLRFPEKVMHSSTSET